ncbi:MAG: succinate dehydrogenase [Planctomycetes bacterium]|nr:succinate dehydrogenase [Planctomycetota bacterium]MBI3845353.1 succinate dehydrogenase [Planctomycetota bacterium]
MSESGTLREAPPASTSLPPKKLLSTERRDSWWGLPLATFLGLSTFGIYSTWAALQGDHYEWGSYLSPFYAPNLKEWFGWDWWKWSPAILILWAPLGFRATCYYYRKAYYRSFFATPPACAVSGAPRAYVGEAKWPLRIQNIHRYFMYVALVFIVILWIDALKAFTTSGPKDYHVGLGNLILVANSYLLSGYTLGCHSLRHLVGGRHDSFEGCGMSYKCWRGVTKLNERHQMWAWLSLFMVGFSDLYIRLLSMGVIKDIKFF